MATLEEPLKEEVLHSEVVQVSPHHDGDGRPDPLTAGGGEGEVGGAVRGRLAALLSRGGTTGPVRAAHARQRQVFWPQTLCNRRFQSMCNQAIQEKLSKTSKNARSDL